jgi:hypothetical protein
MCVGRRHLNLWQQKLGNFPDSVWDQADLETLVLADNNPCRSVIAGVLFTARPSIHTPIDKCFA